MAKRNPKVLYVVREGTGRPSRAVADEMKVCTPTQVRRLRDAALSGMADEEWGWEIGRLFLNGRLTADQFEAGKRWRRLVVSWRRANGIPSASTKPLSYFLEPRSPEPDPDSDVGLKNTERAIALTEEMRLAHGVVISFGKESVKTLRFVVENDCVPIGDDDFARLSTSLRVLSSLWGLTAKGM